MKNSESGFSLVELIAALSIAAIIMTVVSGFLVFHSKNFTATRNKIDLQREAEIAMNQVSELLSESYGIDSYDSSTNVYEFLLKERVEDTSTSEISYIEKRYVLKFDSVESKLIASINGGSDYVVSESVSDFSIRTIDGGSDFEKVNLVKIILVLEKGNEDLEYSHSEIKLSKDVKMRNKHKDDK